MRIAVIGTGNVGGALGKRWAQGGHTVVFAARDPASSVFSRRSETDARLRCFPSVRQVQP